MAYLPVRKRFLKNAAWSRIGNLLVSSGGDNKNLERNPDWETQLKTLWVNFGTLESIYQQSEQKFGNFSQSWWNYRFERFERKFNKYSDP